MFAEQNGPAPTQPDSKRQRNDGDRERRGSLGTGMAMLDEHGELVRAQGGGIQQRR